MKGTFLSAVDAARPLLDHPRLVTRWDQPSSLARMSVGELAAHLTRAVTVTTRYLDTEGAAPYRDAPDYFLVLFPEVDDDLDSEAATGVRARAAREATAGPEGLRASWDGARVELAVRIGDAVLAAGIAVRGSSMRVADYLITRLVELVVHGDDLAASLGEDPPPFSPPVTGKVVDCLVQVAVRRHGATAVIRSLARKERADPAVLRVF